MSGFDLVIELHDLFDNLIKLRACIVDLSSATLGVKIILGLYVARQRQVFILFFYNASTLNGSIRGRRSTG